MSKQPQLNGVLKGRLEPKRAVYILIIKVLLKYMVRVEGLEPPRLAAPEPKSGASTNFATPACKNIKVSAVSLSKGY